MPRKDYIVTPGPAREPLRLPSLPLIPVVVPYVTPNTQTLFGGGCMFDAIMKNDPLGTKVLGLVCPCPRCTPTCLG